MKRFLLFFLMGVVIFHPFSSVQAATYEIKINPLNTQKEHTILCRNLDKFCFLTLSFFDQSKHEIYIDSAMRIDQKTAYFQFMYDREYLAVTSIDKKVLEIPLDHQKKKHEVTLYIPNPTTEEDRAASLRLSPVLRPSGQTLVRLEIFIKKIQ